MSLSYDWVLLPIYWCHKESADAKVPMPECYWCLSAYGVHHLYVLRSCALWFMVSMRLEIVVNRLTITRIAFCTRAHFFNWQFIRIPLHFIFLPSLAISCDTSARIEWSPLWFVQLLLLLMMMMPEESPFGWHVLKLLVKRIYHASRVTYLVLLKVRQYSQGATIFVRKRYVWNELHNEHHRLQSQGKLTAWNNHTITSIHSVS